MDAITLHLIPNAVGQSSGLHLNVPVFAHAASPVGECNSYAGPDETTTGMVCEQCSDFRSWDKSAPRIQVRHASVEHVRECYYLSEQNAAEQAAEIYAEGGYLRWAEGGWDKTGAYAHESFATPGW